MQDLYGEVKVRKNFYPANARELVEKNTVSILITSSKLSLKTKEILKSANITVYEGISEDDVRNIRKSVASNRNEGEPQ